MSVYRYLLLCCCLFILSPILTGAEDIVSAVTFATDSGQWVATVDSNDEWTITRIEENVFQGIMDFHRILPVWSPDGHSIYMAVTLPDSMIASQIYRFDIETYESEFVLEPFDGASLSLDLEGVMFGEFSPDGRYLWAYQTVILQKSYLIDLETNSVIYQVDGWHETVDWQHGIMRTTQASSVIPFIQSDPTIYHFDFATETVSEQVTYPLSDEWIFATAILLDDGQVLVQDNADTIRLVNWQTEENNILANGHSLSRLNSDEAVFIDESSNLMRINLDTLEIEQINENPLIAGYIGIEQELFRVEGDSLIYVEQVFESDNDTSTLNWIRQTDDDREITELYTGNDSNPIISLISPAYFFRTVSNQTVNIRAYNADRPLYEGGYPQDDISINWGDDGQLVLQAYDTRGQDLRIDVHIDPQTETITLPPEWNMRRVSVSPDGRWWFYSYSQPDLYDDGFVAGLVAYQPETDTTIELLPDDETFQLPDSYDMFIWSGQ